jgi:hypothetical protein
MAGRRRQPANENPYAGPRSTGLSRLFCVVLFFGVVLTQIPLVSAHDGTEIAGLSQWHGILVILGGLLFTGGVIFLKQTYRTSPTTALYGVFFGLVVTVLGVVIFEGLTPDRVYTASSMPFPRSWYPPLALSIGLLIAILSFIVGGLRWPDRPRYAIFGLLMGLWVSYPYLIPGPASNSHPFGYALVLVTPLLVGYIIWRDVWGVLQIVLRDPVVRRFGIGIGSLVGLFFMAVSGYVSFVFEEGTPHETAVAVLPVNYQLVTWPTLEVALPQIPLFFALSVGILTIVGSLSFLVGLNAALIARHWRVEEQASTTEGTAGTAALLGACTCGCCGPLVAKVAVLAAGPSVAAPLYWIFVDSASPLGSLFIIASIGLFMGSLVYSVEKAKDPDRSTSIVPSTELRREGG